MSELLVVQVLWTMLRARLDATRGDERGSPTIETVLIAAGLAAAALAAIVIIAGKITDKANNIPTS